VYGFIMAFAHMGYDGLHPIIAFNTARAVHTHLLVVWLITGFHLNWWEGRKFLEIPLPLDYLVVRFSVREAFMNTI
jgi:nitric oxide reductase subunit B